MKYDSIVRNEIEKFQLSIHLFEYFSEGIAYLRKKFCILYIFNQFIILNPTKNNISNGQ